MKSEKKNDLRKCVHKHLASDVPIDFISSDKRWKGRWKISVKTSMYVYVYVYCSQWRRKQTESGGLDVLETLTSEIRVMVMVTYMFKFGKKRGGLRTPPHPNPLGSDVYGSRELNIAKRYDQIKFNHTFINNNTQHNCNIVSLTNRSQDVYGVTSVDHMTVIIS